jgi:hypothetical protein
MKIQVIKPGEKIEISLAEGRWLIVKMPPPALIESREVVGAAMSVSTGSDVTVSRRCDGVTRADVTASHQPQSVLETKRLTASVWSFGSVEAAPS